MNLINYYWYFKSALPKKLCEDIIKHGKNQQEQLAFTGNLSEKINKKEKISKKEIKDLKKKRNSNVAWISDPWIYKEIHPYIHMANRNAGWNFQWDWSESCQFTKYKLNQFYDWHCDSWDSPYNKPDDINYHGKIRKLSVTCSLSDPKDYKGGELEFDFRNMDPDKKRNVRKCEEILPQGSIVVFPSFVWHRVRPVTKGTRYSLVIWTLGKPFI
jgi:PKHD-type hydroxylase